MDTQSPTARRRLAAVLAGTMVLGGAGLGLALPATAAPGFELDRLAGVDRYATAAAIAREGFGDADVVLLANGDSDDPSTPRDESRFPDALTGSYLAGALAAPTLLTRTDSLPDATAAVLDEIRPRRVVLLGGTTAISAAQEQELEQQGYEVDRFAGDDRYGTSAAVARSQGAAAVGSVDGQRTAIVASGTRFPDALVAGPLAYAADLPLTITDPASLSAATREVLVELDVEQVLVPGGEAAVSAEVERQLEQELDITVVRFAGTTRGDTAQLVAEFALAELGFSDEHVDLALGLRFPDALTGGPHSGRERAPILLTADVDALGADARDFLEAHADTLLRGHVFGGPAAVNAQTEADAEEAGRGEPGPSPSPSPSPTQPTDGLTVTPDSDAATVTATANPDATTADDRSYSISGLTTGEEYRITVVKAENVTVDEQGEAVFVEDGTTGLADTGAPTTDITTVNGAPAQNNGGDGTTRSANPAGSSPSAVFTAGSSGTATFVLDGDSEESVRPVVYRNGGSGNGADDGGSSPRLELQEDGTPAEEYDTGGIVRFSEAASQETAATTRPELASAEVVGVLTDAEAGESSSDALTPAMVGTSVRYVFDEPLNASAAVAENLFHVYSRTGTRFDGSTDDAAEGSRSGETVVVLFDDVRTEEAAAALTLATVDLGAVTDAENEQNPVGDAPVGDSGTTTVTFPAGRTEAPDLRSVSGFTATTTDDDPTTLTVDESDATAVVFTFDEQAFVGEPAGFHLVTVDGQDVTCTAVEGGTADTTVTADCPNFTEGETITLADVARGYVDAATVSDDDPATAVVEGDGATNPLQASETPDEPSSDPDLVSAVFERNTDQTTGTTDTVLYTFSEAVRIANAASSPVTGDPDGASGAGDFAVYDADGVERFATAVAPVTGSSNQVRATFADTVLDRGAGASVRAGAVAAEVGSTTRENEADEVGVSNSRTETVTQTAGRTDTPDLIAARVETATNGAGRGVYVFDEDLATDRQAVAPGRLFLVQADGTLLVCTTAALDSTQRNAVVCSAYAIAQPNGTASALAATNSQIRSSVVGAVDDDAVIADDAPASGGTVSDFGNPEGAELLSGSTGTPQE